jgi:hypothetical protein
VTLSRRDFIASIAAAVTGAAIAPELIKAAPKSSPKGSLSLAALNEAYSRCWYGQDQPDLIMISPETYSELLAVCESMQRFSGNEYLSGCRGLVFNGATIGVSKYMKDDQVWVQNTKHPLNPHLNGMFDLGA